MQVGRRTDGRFAAPPRTLLLFIIATVIAELMLEL